MRADRALTMAAFSLTVVVGAARAGSLPVGPENGFDVPGVEALPLNVEILSEKTAEGVKTVEFYMDGAPFNGKPTRIYAFYSQPVKPGRYPAVVELHGAGLQTLSSEAGIHYATNDFCCLTIDWCGPAPGREPPRQPPFSIVDTPGGMSSPPRNADGTPVKGVKWGLHGVESNAFRNGVLFVRRGVLFLKSRPEVDPDRLCISGMSAGAFLTLLAIEHEPAFTAAAVKYGCGFVTLPGYRLGGYFVPLTLCTVEDQDRWIAVFDPKHKIERVRASVLMLSGTDDHFFWMPMVLQTYRAIASPKRLLMLPNDNHSQVGNWRTPLAYFRSAYGLAPAWPIVEPPGVRREEKELALDVKASSPAGIANVAFWVKRMPLATFKFKRDLKMAVGDIEPWREVMASESEGSWHAAIPLPADGEQIVVYVTAEDKGGVQASSDTVEIPEYPSWRGLAAP